jgi:hypothetical protein
MTESRFPAEAREKMKGGSVFPARENLATHSASSGTVPQRHA